VAVFIPIELTDSPVGAEGAGTVGGAVGVKEPLSVAAPMVDLALFVPLMLAVTPAATFTVPDLTLCTRLVLKSVQDDTPVPVVVAALDIVTDVLPIPVIVVPDGMPAPD
jgi:hypothetical protein